MSIFHRHMWVIVSHEEHLAQNCDSTWSPTCGSESCNGLTRYKCNCGSMREWHRYVRESEEVR